MNYLRYGKQRIVILGLLLILFFVVGPRLVSPIKIDVQTISGDKNRAENFNYNVDTTLLYSSWINISTVVKNGQSYTYRTSPFYQTSDLMEDPTLQRVQNDYPKLFNDYSQKENDIIRNVSFNETQAVMIEQFPRDSEGYPQGNAKVAVYSKEDGSKKEYELDKKWSGYVDIPYSTIRGSNVWLFVTTYDPSDDGPGVGAYDIVKIDLNNSDPKSAVSYLDQLLVSDGVFQKVNSPASNFQFVVNESNVAKVVTDEDLDVANGIRFTYFNFDQEKWEHIDVPEAFTEMNYNFQLAGMDDKRAVLASNLDNKLYLTTLDLVNKKVIGEPKAVNMDYQFTDGVSLVYSNYVPQIQKDELDMVFYKNPIARNDQGGGLLTTVNISNNQLVYLGEINLEGKPSGLSINLINN